VACSAKSSCSGLIILDKRAEGYCFTQCGPQELACSPGFQRCDRSGYQQAESKHVSNPAVARIDKGLLFRQEIP
jgi:hypothetical protein